MMENWKKIVKNLDERRDIAIPGDKEQTLRYCVMQFIEIANVYIEKQGYFSIALSGGSTPKPIYQSLASPENRNKIAWEKVLLFWSDERAVPPSDKESNYRMVMDAGFASLPLKPEHIFRMHADKDIEKNAEAYEQLILTEIPNQAFDAILLGMGDDGHTASLFPMTHALKVENRLVTSNFIPQKDTWRMTLTYKCINASQHILLYVFGQNKSEIVTRVLTGSYDPDLLPVQKVGTPTQPALWILDSAAASGLPK